MKIKTLRPTWRPEAVDPDPNEIPEQEESEQEGSGYTPGTGSTASHRKVTTPHSVSKRMLPRQTIQRFHRGGPGQSRIFESRAHGRTTGRMVGHEPGTEGI
jgi:hypothetical protein